MRDQQLLQMIEQSFATIFRLRKVTGFIGDLPADQVSAHFLEGQKEQWEQVFQNLDHYFGSPVKTCDDFRISVYFWAEPKIYLTEVFDGTDYFFIIFPS